MVTKEQAVNATYRDEFHYTGNGECKRTVGPRGGVKTKITVVRVNGKCKTWKTRPEEFELPIKYGLRECGHLTHRNCQLFHLAEECPLLEVENAEGK